jgi:hypothetical protein
MIIKKEDWLATPVNKQATLRGGFLLPVTIKHTKQISDTM